MREIDSLRESHNPGVPQLPNPYLEGAYRAHSDGIFSNEVRGVNPLVSLRIRPFAPEATCIESDRFVFQEWVGKVGALEYIGLGS